VPPIELKIPALLTLLKALFPAALSFLAAAGALKGTDATSCMQSLSLMNINIEFLVLTFEEKVFV
jgi:hypothetical protein